MARRNKARRKGFMPAADQKWIEDAVRREGIIEHGELVLPADFFDRLNAALNPPRQGPSIIDRIVADMDGETGQ